MIVDRLLREFGQNSEEHLRLVHSSVDRYSPYEFAKISDETTKLVEQTDYPYEIGINIDVFVLDNLPGGEKDALEMLRKMRLFKKIMGIKLSVPAKKERKHSKQLLLTGGKWACRQIPMYLLTRKMNRIAGRFAAEDDSEWVADVCQRWFRSTELLRREWFAGEIELEFEGCRFYAPEHYDEVLTTWYGDYMKLPPVEERITHHAYKAYTRE